MANNTAASRIKPKPTPQRPGWIRRLLQYPHVFTSELGQGASRLLSGLLLTLIVFLILAASPLLIIIQNDPIRHLIQILLFCAMAATSSAYLLNRFKLHRLAIWLTLGTLVGGNWGAFFLIAPHVSPSTQRLVISYLLLSVLFSSLFLSARITTLLVALHLVGIMFTVIFMPILATPETLNLSVFFLLTSGSVVAAAFIRERNQVLIDKQTRETLENQARFQAILDNSTALIYLKDPEGRYIQVNRRYESLFNLSRGKIVGRTDVELFSPEMTDVNADTDRHVLQTGTPTEVEENVHQSEEERAYVSLKFPLFSSSGALYGMCSISTDITERKRAQEALQEANEKLKAGLAELELRNQEMALLNAMGDMLQVCMNVEEAYQVIANFGRQLFPHDSGLIAAINESRDLVEIMVGWGELPSEYEKRVFAFNDCWALRRGQAHMVDSSTAHLLCSHLEHIGPTSYLCIPMTAQGEALGVLHLRCATPADLTEAKRQLARTMADSIALALTNLKLRESLRQQSIRDPLTGLFNRRYLEETLEREISRAARNQHSLGIIMLDLDHFKFFNDTFGHAAGDLLLQELGRFLKAHTREADIACRYGGEEFVLILPEVSLETTRERAEYLRQTVKRLRIQYAGQTLGPVTLSIGVAAFPIHGPVGPVLMRTADTALYQAKREGRDRVVVGT